MTRGVVAGARANMHMDRFKTYGYITMSQALGFVSDLKFGHYMKIPPRTMFMAQVVATTLSCFIQVGVLNFALHNIDGVCTKEQHEHFTCPGGRVFFSGTLFSDAPVRLSRGLAAFLRLFARNRSLTERFGVKQPRLSGV